MHTGKVLAVLGAVILLGGCASPARMGMVKDPNTGLQMGSAVEKNIFVDSSQFQNRTMKVSVRNTSGDSVYQMSPFSVNLKNAFSQKGYVPTEADSFGIKVDLNVLYSGHVQRSMAAQYGFLGGAAGGIAGYHSSSSTGTAAGTVLGATLGAIIGSYVTEDTYIVVAEVSIGVTDSVGGDNNNKKTITFGSSPQMQEEFIPRNFRPFREVLRTKIAVFAGGTNTSQQQIADYVRQRLVSIVSDSI